MLILLRLLSAVLLVDTSPDRHFRSRERSAPSAQPAAAGEPASNRLAPPARRPQVGCSPHSAIALVARIRGWARRAAGVADGRSCRIALVRLDAVAARASGLSALPGLRWVSSGSARSYRSAV